jgi:hypothetical protein
MTVKKYKRKVFYFYDLFFFLLQLSSTVASNHAVQRRDFDVKMVENLIYFLSHESKFSVFSKV